MAATWVECCDYSYSHPDPAGLRRAGIEGVLRYQPGVAKGLTIVERDALWAAGLWIRALFESTAARALAGFAAGQADARAARKAWRTVGYPDDLPIIFAVDIDATAAQLAGPITQYFRGIASVESGDEVYGGIDTVHALIKAGLSTGAFQTYAWSAGRWDPSAEFEQYDNGVTIAGGDVDRSRALSTARFWEAPMTGPVDLTPAAITAVRDALLGAPIYVRPAAEQSPDANLTLAWAARGAYFAARYTSNTGGPALAAALAAQATQISGLVAAVHALSTGGVDVDTQKVIDAVTAVGAAESAAVTGLHNQIADLERRLAAAETAGAQAAAAALAPPAGA